MRTKAEKTGLWFAFSVVLALLPLLVNLLMFHVDGKPIAWFELVSHGELFLVAAALSADGLGRLRVRGEIGGTGTFWSNLFLTHRELSPQQRSLKVMRRKQSKSWKT